MFEKTQEITLNITGMSCMHCVAHVEAALKAIKGVKKVKISLENKNALISFVPSAVTPEALVMAVESAGYGAAISL